MGSERPVLKKLVFGVYTKEEIHSLSVVEVKTSLCFNALDHPLKDGLYDLIMGPSGSHLDVCGTCKQTSRNCPGHFGHIDLPLPVVNPLFHKEIFTLLKVSCSYCYKLVIPANLRNLLIYQLKLLDQGHIAEAEELESVISFDEAVTAQNEAMDYIMKDKLKGYIDSLQLTPKDVQPTKTSESLRRKFVNNFLKQVALPKSCSYCKKVFKRISSFQNKLTVPMTKVEIAEKFKDSMTGSTSKQETTFITPQESRDMLRKIWAESRDLIEEFFPLLKNSKLEYPTDLFYMDVILVTPPKARPVNILKDQMIENNQTSAYKQIINNCIIIKNLIRAVQSDTLEVLSDECKTYIQGIRGSTPMEKFQECWLQLQGSVDNLLDTEMNKLTSKKTSLGLKQLIEKKEGILRMHMMGKRVNFAARSVITPDPNLQIQEIGIPEDFAKKLTYPVPVTYFNVEELRKMVQNGPDVYPGATLIENENGSLIRLFSGPENRSKREGVAKLLLKSVEAGGSLNSVRKKVHRHLMNGDILLLNRQPTLHRPSIMAHKARILKGEKTLRMHYSNCKSYNADFDGDEMNAHFPQSDLARSEAYNLVNVSNHYLVPKDGTPLGGLIQDHIVSAVRLTIRGQMFTKDDYHQLVFQGLAHKPGNIKLLPPCIIKPVKLWSGKQIISTILINLIPSNKELISFTGSAKINFKSWETRTPRPWKHCQPFKKEGEMSESEVIIHKGRLVSGVLDKQHFGATPYGLTHCLYELYGGECSSKFLDSVGKLSTAFLQLNGFTLGVEDILVMKHADKARRKIIEKLRNSGEEAAVKALGLEHVPEDLTERLEKEFFKDRIKFKAKLDQEYKKILDSYTNEINKVCLPRGLISQFPDNNLQLMVTSGAKGSTVNTMQISCLLGQIELEGRRPPWMISGKSLPSFKAFETQPAAGGYVDNRFMTGINPQEFFFHCMAGREGLIDTAVKTSRSGYLQRCLIKHLEGVYVCYDGTVRDHDGSVIQFAYGEDGMEVQKSTFFKPECLDFLYKNRDAVVDWSVIKEFKDSTNTKEVEKYKKKLAAWEGVECKKVSPFTVFSNSIRDDISSKYFKEFNKSTGRSKAYTKILKKWKSLSAGEKECYSYNLKPDTVISKFNRNCEFGVITEKLEKIIQDYLNTKLVGKKKESKKMKNMLEAKYMLSLCQPGEPVGLLAAQSVGEPSTQMTLNTFHFAGRGEMNVTLGIPRLREVLMTASKNIKTPYIEVPLKAKSEKKTAKNAKKLKKIFQRVTLADVLEKIVVDEKLQLKPVQMFTYTVRFQFLPHASYKDDFAVKPNDILSYMEKPFLITLCKEIRKLGKKYGDIIYETKEEKAISKPEEDEENADDVDAAGRASKRIKTLGEEHESSDEDEELDDDDATKAKLRGRHQENQEYEEPNESEEEISDEETPENEKNAEAESGDEDVAANLTKEELQNIENRKELILRTFAMVKNYKFDVTKEEWCEFVIGIPLTLSKIDFSTVLRTICEKSVLYEINNVKRAIVYKKMSGELSLKTEGVNFIEIFKFNKMLDLRKLYSNDIHRVIETYGIEAGVRVIMRELRDVFGVYGITVDPRHLLLIADYMTHQGYFSPFNRTGMADSPSPLQQMSFESSTGFLKSSLIRCKQDCLQSPSSCIMVGKFCRSGTGCFDLSYAPQMK